MNVVTPALPLVVRPLHGESAVGFIMRLAEKNGISYPALFERVAGGRHNPDNWDDAAWKRLADIALVDVVDLDSMRCRPVDLRVGAGVTFLGFVMRRSYLVFDRMRLCPLCIGEGGVIREMWKLMHCVACIEHGTYLVDQCDCGRPLHIIRRGPKQEPQHDCCPCGKPFSEISTQVASDHALHMTHWLVQLFGPRLTATAPRLWLSGRMLPPPLDGQSHTIAPPAAPVHFDNLDLPPVPVPLDQTDALHPLDALAALELIGRVATTPASQDRPRSGRTLVTSGGPAAVEPMVTTIDRVEAAMTTINDWPNAWHAILEDVAGRNAAAGDATAEDLFATEIGKLILHPFTGVDGFPIAILADETKAWLGARGYTARTKEIYRVSRVAMRLRTVMPKSEVIRRLGGYDGVGLRRAYSQVMKEFDRTDTHAMDDGELAEAVLERIRSLVDVVEQHVSTCVVAETLCSRDRRTGGAVWIDSRLLTPLRIEHVMNKRFKGDVFARADIEAMQVRLAAASRLVGEDEIPDGFARYGDVSGSTTSTFYGGADLIVDILSGDVPSVRTVDTPTLADLWIAVRAVETNVLSCRVASMVDHDRFLTAQSLKQLMSKLWPGRGAALMKELRRLRESDVVRFEDLRTEEGGKPSFRHSVRDCLREAEIMFGPSGIKAVDDLIERLKSSLFGAAA